VRRDIIHPYPFVAVTVTCGIITVEAVALYAILRPPTYSQHPRRAVAAFAIFLPWCVAEFFFISGWTDQAGYCYANGLFLRFTLVLLLVIACFGFLARTRTRTQRSSMPR